MSKALVLVPAFLALASAARSASAEDGPVPGDRDRNVAFALSSGGTALSIGLVALGAHGDGTLAMTGLLSSLVTPAAGEFYAGKMLTWGTGIRVVSGVAAVVGLAVVVRCTSLAVFVSGPCRENPDAAAALMVTGAVGYAAGIVYDIATAGSAVDDYNRRLHLRITPTILQTASSRATVALGIGGSF
jgi:hypothetical protein